MIINKPLVRKEIRFEPEERDAIRNVAHILYDIFNDMAMYDKLDIEYYDEEYSYNKDTLLDTGRFIEHLLYMVYIQEGEQDE